MGERGWAPHEVDRMWVWQVAMFLGHGTTEGPVRSVMRGSRSIQLKSDDDDQPEGEAWKPGVDPAMQARLAAYDEAERTGVPVTGTAVLVPPPQPDGT